MKALLQRLLTILVIISSFCLAQTATAPSLGDGTSGNPYQIATWENLYWISQNSGQWSKYYIQTANINFADASPAINTWSSGAGWTPIGNTSTNFTGSYNGQGYTITGLYINRSSTDYIGLFGYTNSASSISNVALVSGSVIGHNYVGTLVRANIGGTSTINNCYNTGTVSGYLEVGGLVGQNYNGTITSSYNSGTIGNGVITTSGSYYVGGMVGHNHYGTIRNCYSTGAISGYYGIGGLVGYNNTDGGTVDKCYSTGYITAYASTIGGLYRYGGLVGDCCSGPVNNSFWDTQASGTSLSPSGKGTGKTTTEMKTQTTFTNAGWDFTTVWEIVGGDGANYPRLRNNPDSALPVELISFTGIINGNSVELNWQTATEVNNYGFNIERRIKSEEWKQISFVQGHGNSNSPKEYSFTDKFPPSGKVEYRLRQIDFDGKFSYSNVIEVNLELPTKIILEQNHPNPFNPETIICYQIPESGIVSLKVYDTLGNVLTQLVGEFKNAGRYEVKFDGSKLSSGIYFYKIDTGNYSSVRKMMLIK